ncbi:alpha/beta fold hydrolase [Halapricum hydrolyticum]|uniref:Alpha/beta hydrolase n=1 Tax=Halapricum hydrolyticum TaxID=2979991 RepID=A0AAE3LET9_9EURY|nr:alpha/beta hydrolase [Halapricum hydrolyticum]MCU4718407.1 alpha/beta hydrolase [Halapricum hydrolyticum]MCU4726480.1 alpha/beta hydrolase [Halapricum hydrolyticum]
MKLRNVLAAGVGGLGFAAASNRLLQSRASDLEAPLPGELRSYRWRGFNVGYTKAGDPQDPELVLVHGINAAATSREFETVFESLAEEYHVLAPDLPGFGTTDRPPLLYSAPLYEQFLVDFLEDLTDEPTVVASGLSGAYVTLAARDLDVSELVLICPTGTTMGGDGKRTWVRSLLRSPLVGQALFNALVSKPSMRHFHADHGYYDMDNLTEERLDYEWHSAHQEGARFAPASFLGGFLDPDESLEEALPDVDAPVTLVWGRDASTTPLSAGRSLADASDAKLVVFDEATLLPHVEHPEQFAELLVED